MNESKNLTINQFIIFGPFFKRALYQLKEPGLTYTFNITKFETKLYLLCYFQDLLMVIYLTQLSKTQLQLHEKLSTISVNQLKDYQKLLPE